MKNQKFYAIITDGVSSQVDSHVLYAPDRNSAYELADSMAHQMEHWLLLDKDEWQGLKKAIEKAEKLTPIEADSYQKYMVETNQSGDAQ